MKHLTIENKTGRVKLDDTVDEYSRRELAKEMAKVFGPDAFTNPDFTNLTNAAGNEIDRLEIEINSPGGSVFDGLVIVNELRAMSAKGVRTVAIVNALAASMGSVIAASCDECQIVPNGRMMIHDVSVFAGGTSKDLQRMADLCDGLSNEIAGIYAAKTGKTPEEMRAMMLDETWLDANQCVELGLADSVFDFNATNSNVPPMSLLARLTNPAAPEAIEQITGLQARVSELETDLTAAATELQTLAADLAARDETISDISAKLNEADRLANENAQTIADLRAKLETQSAATATAQASAPVQAVQILATVGQPEPVATTGDAEPVNHLEIMAKLPPGEKRAYWLKHIKGQK